MSKLIVEADHVGHIYQTPQCEKETLKDMSFQIEEYESVSPDVTSGCGESTLMTIIAGPERRTLGAVQLDGRPVTAPMAESRHIRSMWVFKRSLTTPGPKKPNHYTVFAL